MKSSEHNSRSKKTLSSNSGRVKQVDVANLAGVARATVSRVLNNYTDKFSVRPEVRQRVLDAAASLGYRPDLMAHTLRKKASGGLVGWLGSLYPITFSTNVLEALTETLSTHGLLLSPTYATDSKKPITLPWWRIDAAVVSGVREPEGITEIEAANLPYVCVNCVCGPKGSSVQMNDVEGMNLACAHLLELGHRKIVYAVRDPVYMGGHPSVAARQGAYKTVMRDAGLTPLNEGSRWSPDRPDEFVQEVVVRRGVSAILTYSCHSAILLLGALQRAGLRVPQDVSLVSFNDEYPLKHLNPSVTVVELDGRAAGHEAAELIVAHVTDPSREPIHRVLPEKLIIRESTAAPARQKTKRGRNT